MLNQNEKDYLIKIIESGEEIPEKYREKLFPVDHKEYELTYSDKITKENLLSDKDGSIAVPLQIEAVFNGDQFEKFDDEWRNILVFGDNLQLLKLIYQNTDPILKNKVKGKVKLIYIDPPFATSDEFQNRDGAKAYNDRKKGSEFIEFIRRRLIIAREILADDGSIYIHLDWKKVHYIKIIMDEVFGENKFRNQIIWKYFGPTSTERNFPRKHDVILFYTKSDNYFFNSEASYIEYDEKAIKRYDKTDEDGRKYKIYKEKTGAERRAYLNSGKPTEIFEIPFVQGTSNERLDYPTQKPELLIERIIRASTKEGDIVFDFFGGSGTTMSVAEKLGRKWIVCDIGKLSFYTMQKRILQINKTKDLLNTAVNYKKNARTFITCKIGNYDLKQALDLEWSQYKDFVSGLFNIKISLNLINGIEFDGTKDDYPVLIFNYNLFRDSKIDNNYLNNLHQQISRRINGSRIYIVAPYYKFDFIQDYIEIDKIRYFFLKIPYQMIKELHITPFQKFRQPTSKDKINSYDEVKGFSFNRKPDVTSCVRKTSNELEIQISNFKCNELLSDKSNEEKNMSGFDLLSAVFIDKKFNGQAFIMTDYLFSEDIEKNELGLMIKLSNSDVGDKVMIIYTDIYGNDFVEIIDI